MTKNKLFEVLHQLTDNERLAFNLIILVRSEVVNPYAKQGGKLAKVLLCHHHLFIFT